ncbi:hypothetical protein BC941DRAFT_475807 [Chlamydoabsidia padenii]|nr:hypothetical protein BC941DRAFT_475807 [Chlamydoabsidia padenii]
MDLATILNPTSAIKHHDYSFPYLESTYHATPLISHMKPRSRFSALEDAIICQGVANGLTWGQISNQLPHRKRATCFNRYRTLQGIRKSRPQSAMDSPPSRYRRMSTQWFPPSSPPGLDRRRLSTCSTLSSSSSLPSPSILQHDQWSLYSRRASVASTSSSSSFSSLSTLYPHY